MQILHLWLALNWVGLVSCTLKVKHTGNNRRPAPTFRTLLSYAVGKSNAKKWLASTGPITAQGPPDSAGGDLVIHNGEEIAHKGVREDAGRAHLSINHPAARSNVSTEQGRDTSLSHELSLKKLTQSKKPIRRRRKSFADKRGWYIRQFAEYARTFGGDQEEKGEQTNLRAAPKQWRESAGGPESTLRTGSRFRERSLADVTGSAGRAEIFPPQRSTLPVMVTRAKIVTNIGPAAHAEYVDVSESPHAAEALSERENRLLRSVSAEAAATPVEKLVEGSVNSAEGGGVGLHGEAIERDGNSADPRNTYPEATNSIQRSKRSNQGPVDRTATATDPQRAYPAQGRYESGGNSGRDGKPLSREERQAQQRLDLAQTLGALLSTAGARLYILQMRKDEAGRTGREAGKSRHSDTETNETGETRIHGSTSTCVAAGCEHGSKVFQPVQAPQEGENGYQRASAERTGESSSGGEAEGLPTSFVQEQRDFGNHVGELSGQASETTKKVPLVTLMEAILEKAATVLYTLERSRGEVIGGRLAGQETNTDGGSNTAETTYSVEGGIQQAGDSITSRKVVNDADVEYRSDMGEDCRTDSGNGDAGDEVHRMSPLLAKGDEAERVPGDGAEKEETTKETAIEPAEQKRVEGAEGPRKTGGRRVLRKDRRQCRINDQWTRNEGTLVSPHPTPFSSSENTEMSRNEHSTPSTAHPGGSEPSSRLGQPKPGPTAPIHAIPHVKNVTLVQLGIARSLKLEHPVAAKVPPVMVREDASVQRGGS